MKNDNGPVEEESSEDEVPAYIVTFSDMTTLLMTFFVMLLSLATVQDPSLMNKGRDSFVKSLDRFGLGVFMGSNVTPGLDTNKEKHKVPENEPNATRTIDADTELRRRAFKRLDRDMITMPAQVAARRADFSHIPGLSFSPGSARLTDASREVLLQFIANLRSGLAGRKGMVYVLGLARQSGSRRQCWTLAAQRAQVVADVINQELNAGQPNPSTRVYAWGAGPGYQWAGSKGPIASDAQILIAVLQ